MSVQDRQTLRLQIKGARILPSGRRSIGARVFITRNYNGFNDGLTYPCAYWAGLRGPRVPDGSGQQVITSTKAALDAHRFARPHQILQTTLGLDIEKIGCPESFTEPLAVYQKAKARGMTHVTITDHNRIDGALEIAHLPDTFVSEEITTYFPEDSCKLHVLALDITEAQHEDIQRLRQNLFDLVAYLREQEITHVLAHPLYGVNDRLTVEHFEQTLVLFNHFEMNGARNDAANDCLEKVVRQLTPECLSRLADRYGIDPHGDTPWKKCLTGGSDDHSSLNIARTYTDIPGPSRSPTH